MAEQDNDGGSVDSLVDNIVSTISKDQGNGDGNAGAAGAGQDASGVDNGSGTAPNADGSQSPAAGADGKPIDPAAKADQGTPSQVDEAVKHLETVLGKKLSDVEAVEEMAKSTLNSTAKIQQQAEDIKDLANRNQAWEKWFTENNINEVITLLQDPAVQQAIEQIRSGAVSKNGDEGYGNDDIPPAVQKRMDEMARELQSLKSDRQSETKTKQKQEAEQKSQEYTKSINEFSKKDAAFKAELDAYAARVKDNPYAKLPEKLQKWDSLVRNGVDGQTAWDVINKDNLAKKITEDISKKQNDKSKAPPVLQRSGQKPPAKSYDEIAANDTDGFMDLIMQNASRNSR